MWFTPTEIKVGICLILLWDGLKLQIPEQNIWNIDSTRHQAKAIYSVYWSRGISSNNYYTDTQ